MPFLSDTDREGIRRMRCCRFEGVDNMSSLFSRRGERQWSVESESIHGAEGRGNDEWERQHEWQFLAGGRVEQRPKEKMATTC